MLKGNYDSMKLCLFASNKNLVCDSSLQRCIFCFSPRDTEQHYCIGFCVILDEDGQAETTVARIVGLIVSKTDTYQSKRNPEMRSTSRNEPITGGIRGA